MQDLQNEVMSRMESAQTQRFLGFNQALFSLSILLNLQFLHAYFVHDFKQLRLYWTKRPSLFINNLNFRAISYIWRETCEKVHFWSSVGA